ncbi:MAG: hypothetical protein IPL53_13590 [Ignavibacteria bacterium]|nr:hypothetical protein [Ignavibacteria bacterium]
MNDSLEKKIKELEEIIEIINKDNALLRFENDNLIKQSKLQTAIVENCRKELKI